MWGNISGSFYIDLQRAKVFNYDGAIKGPAFFSQPVLKILHERFGIIRSSFKLYCMHLLAHSTHLALWQAKQTKYDSVSTPLLTARYDLTQQPPIKNILRWHVPKKQNQKKKPMISFSPPGNGWKQTFKTWYAVSVQLWLQRRAEQLPCLPPTGSSLS